MLQPSAFFSGHSNQACDILATACPFQIAALAAKGSSAPATLYRKTPMKRLIVALTMTSILSLVGGCAQKDTATKETTVKTPGGSTKTTEKVEVERTGDHKNK